MMSGATLDPGITGKLRHMCRNPRCGLKLREPVENTHAAFCVRGCWEQFHRQRCVVCERPKDQKRGRIRLVCERRLCRAELKKWPDQYQPFAHKVRAGTLPNSVRSADRTGTKTRAKGPRGWYWVEGIEKRCLHDREGRLAARIAQEGEGWWVAFPGMTPEPPIESLDDAIKRAETVALWTLPLDPATAQRIRAANRALWRDHPRNPIKAQIQRHHTPVNLPGGYKFPDAPVLDLSPLDTPVPAENSASAQSGSVQSRWEPSTASRDLNDDIPAFLKRAAS